jgi:hypothetical protein
MDNENIQGMQALKFEYVTSRFTDNARTVCEVLWKNVDETAENYESIVAVSCEASDSDELWRELLTVVDIDTIHENTYNYIKEQDAIYKDQVIKIAKERGLIYDIDSVNNDIYKPLVEFTFGTFNPEKDKEKLFMLKLQLFELDPIKSSSDRAAKAALRKAPDIITALKYAIDIFSAQSTEETST